MKTKKYFMNRFAIHYFPKLLLFFFLCSAYSSAQNSVNTSGGDFTSNDGSIAFSIGQVDFSNYTNASGEINLGVQQPFEILLVSVHENALNWQVDIFPNPTADKVFVRLEDHHLGVIAYELFDVSGKLLLAGNMEDLFHSIELDHFSPATYLLKLSNNETTLKTFRLVKQ